ncbi:MAG: rod shape-determining protein MreD [Lachnospiraceae bacterium]|jgi:rod shape-determining protein MreD|nr:rod shape-determining protein MreD [Lachnospiraceae bacterium]MEE3461598.1 rod shape-determining protein MreD [Lachnospiraceae bacterium]
MKRYISAFFLILFLFLLETAVLKRIFPSGVMPDLLLSATCIYALLYGRGPGMFAGVMSGLLIDIMFFDVIGINALIYLLIGYTCALFRKYYSKNDIVVPFIVLASADLVQLTLFYVFSYLLRGRLAFLSYLVNIIIPDLIYTAVFGMLIVLFAVWLDRKMYPVSDKPIEDEKQRKKEAEGMQ